MTCEYDVYDDKGHMMIARAFTAIKFYVYGKSHFTRTGWEWNSAAYQQSIHDWEGLSSISGKVFMVTGSKFGI